MSVITEARIEALGYLGLEVSDPDQWRQFATGHLGMQAVDMPEDGFCLRMDNAAARIFVSQGPADDIAFAGWEVRDASALAALTIRLEQAGVRVEQEDAALAARRRVAGLVRFSDPEGNAHEAFYGALQKTNDPFISPTGVRFKTGRQGLGHIVYACRDKAAMMDFFIEALGFRLSDHINTEVVPGRPLELSFLRCNGRHHSLALAPLPVPKKLVHLMCEVTSIDDVGRAMHRCLADNVHLSFTLGRHSNDQMLSFYALSPSGFDVEYGWGGLEVEDESWHVLTHDCNSAWGHVFQRPPRPPKSGM
ncbi:Biphenyl-2,3-diol 1,2-dioxygenase 1 [Novosphingobium lubricantis]|jgi:2,3-dihydroxybiphenyl 1,2-dioxygenase